MGGGVVTFGSGGGGRGGGVRQFHYESVDSTNEAAKRLLVAGEIDGAGIVSADEQTAGKGTYGRRWLSPRGAGLYFSIVDAPGQAIRPLTAAYTLGAGIACWEALSEHAAVQVRIKPINDLYVGQRKLGGILTETIIRQGAIAALITGIGINTRRCDRRLPEGSVEPISLEEAVDFGRFGELNFAVLREAIAARVLSWNERIARGDLEGLARAGRGHGIPEDVLGEALSVQPRQ